jgi:6-phosphogluconolactonase (cycloisomerase 2 family)
MGTEQRRLSSSRRNALKNVIRLIPAVVILATMLSAVSCNNNNGLLPQDNGGGSKSPTATPTAGTGALAFVTNFNDGKVSSFTRNITTGVLKLQGQVKAGAKSGPRGVIASPSGSFLYVANLGDDNIYEFSVNQTNGTLTPLSPPSVSNGNNTEPDELAMNSGGTLLWVTGAKGTVTAYTVNTSTGQITKKSSLGGFNTPFGIAVHPTLTVLYVSDTVTGLIQPLSYNTTTGALAANLPAVSSSDPNAVVPAAITIDAAGAALFTPDQGNGEVSSFAINSTTGALTRVGAFTNSNVGDKPVGIGIGTNAGNEFVFTANFGGASVSSFLVTNSTTLNPPPALASGYNAPKGLVVDPQNVFVYTADSGDGTVSQSTINGSCGSSICAGPVVSTESPANPSSGPFGITLAQ